MQLALAKQSPIDDLEAEPLKDKPPKERLRILKALLAAGIFFLWDSKRGKFISTKTGRVIRADTLRKWVIAAADKYEERLAQLAEKLAPGPIAAAGQITQREFQVTMQRQIASAEGAMASSAIGGLKQMKAPEWQRVGIQIRKQQTALVGFGQDIVQTKLSPAEIAARARLYARAIYATHMNEMTVNKQSMGAKYARRILHQGSIHCEDCPPLAKLGWVPIEDLVPIGDTACIVNCRCAIEYSGEGEPNPARMIGMPD